MLGEDLSFITICICSQQATCMRVDLSHVNVGELSAELKTVSGIRGSACHMLNALLRLHYHNLIVVDNLRLEAIWQT